MGVAPEPGNHLSSNYTQLIKTLRTYVPRIPIVPGICECDNASARMRANTMRQSLTLRCFLRADVKNSAEGWVPPSSVSSLIELTTEMYNRTCTLG